MKCSECCWISGPVGPGHSHCCGETGYDVYPDVEWERQCPYYSNRAARDRRAAQQRLDEVRPRRERIATKLLQGLLANPAWSGTGADVLRAKALEQADALVAALDEGE